MTRQITRESGIILTKDSKIPTVLYVRYSSKNMPHVTGTISAMDNGWLATVSTLPPPDEPDEYPPVTFMPKAGRQGCETLETAIEAVEEQIRNWEAEFDKNYVYGDAVGNRQRREVDALFGSDGK